VQKARIPRLFHEVVAGIGRDMDGRVLSTAFEQSTQIETIDSWENIDGDDGRHPPEMQDEHRRLNKLRRRAKTSPTTFAYLHGSCNRCWQNSS
jgi:hypothetical protein